MYRRMTRLTPFETALKHLGGIVFAPFAPFITFQIQQNTRGVLMRFGKVDRVIEPGLRWAPPFGDLTRVFIGAKTHTFKDMRLLDATGTPIVVSAILQYHVSNPAAYIIAANQSTDILEREASIAIRQACSSLPYTSDDGKSLQKNAADLSYEVYKKMQILVSEYGFQIDGLNIIEVNYAHEVAQQMLIKQQAKAFLDARKEIVSGALAIAKDTIASLPDMSKRTQEAIVSNLLTTLTSTSTPQPTVMLR